jgi:hypothetical protein
MVDMRIDCMTGPEMAKATRPSAPSVMPPMVPHFFSGDCGDRLPVPERREEREDFASSWSSAALLLRVDEREAGRAAGFAGTAAGLVPDEGRRFAAVAPVPVAGAAAAGLLPELGALALALAAGMRALEGAFGGAALSADVAGAGAGAAGAAACRRALTGAFAGAAGLSAAGRRALPPVGFGAGAAGFAAAAGRRALPGALVGALDTRSLPGGFAPVGEVAGRRDGVGISQP